MATKKTETQRPQDIASKAEPFVKRMEYLDAEMQAKREEIAESKKIVREEAEDAGITKKSLARTLKLRKQKRDDAAALGKMTVDERAQALDMESLVLADIFEEVDPAFAESIRNGEVSVTVHPAQDPIDDFAR